ncbi:unnamed protein product [Protopolystoma xenopodis]|uniref:Uncharacterized protein n=1 Tax=Protopolystoma xenopodis TaxID=117903 RepID=A0A3S5CJP7_9PLAT|nr:unnamed protein product [Protopolystoma xenopodis]
MTKASQCAPPIKAGKTSRINSFLVIGPFVWYEGIVGHDKSHSNLYCCLPPGNNRRSIFLLQMVHAEPSSVLP